MRTLRTALMLAAAATIAAGGAAVLGEEATPAKTPRRKWQDVPQPPLPKLADPKPVVATLRNGMKVFLVEDRELPTIDVTVILRAGELDLPALYGDGARAKAGLASMTTEVMRTGGTTSRTGDQLDEELDAMAASVEVSGGDDQTRVRLSCLTESFDATLAILVDVLSNPAFREDKIALAKRQRLGSIRRRNDNPAQLAGRELARLMYGDASPFGWTEEVETVDGIAREDLVRFYKDAICARPGTALVGAVGDFDAAKMKAKLEAALGGFGAGADANAKAAPADRAVATTGFEGPGPRLFFVRKTDVNQATVLLAHTGIQRQPGDPDYPAAMIANSILGGGGFAGRLMQRVRTEMGLAYGCSSRLDAAYGHQGLFVMQGQTKSGSTLAMTRAMRKELERLVSEPPSAEELRVAKQAILERLVFSFDRKSDILDRALRNELYGFPPDELETFQKGVAAVTADDVLRVAKKLLRPAHLTTLVVGNDAEFDGKLEELGAKVETIEIKTQAPRGGRQRRDGETPGRN